MRAVRTGFLLLAIPAAVALAADGEADRFAARAFVTSRVLARLDDPAKKMLFADPLLREIGESDAATWDKSGGDALLAELDALLGGLGTGSPFSAGFVAACDACARFAGSHGRAWELRAAENSALGGRPRDVVRWTEALAKSGGDKARIATTAQNVVDSCTWWPDTPPDEATATARLKLLETLLAAAPGTKLRKLVAGLSGAVKQAKGRIKEQPGVAAGTLAWVARLHDRASQAGAKGLDGALLGLKRLSVQGGPASFEPAQASWPKSRREFEDLNANFRPGSAFVEGHRLPVRDGLHVVSGLTYLFVLQQGATRIPCLARWAGDQGLGFLQLPAKLPRGYAVIHGLDGATWLVSRDPWTRRRAAIELLELVAPNEAVDGADKVKAYFTIILTDKSFRTPARFFIGGDRAGLRNWSFDGQDKTGFDPEQAIGLRDLALEVLKGIRLVPVALFERVPPWARDKLGWSGSPPLMLAEGEVDGPRRVRDAIKVTR